MLNHVRCLAHTSKFDSTANNTFIYRNSLNKLHIRDKYKEYLNFFLHARMNIAKTWQKF